MSGDQARQRYHDICVLGQWRLARGETQGAEAAIRRLQAAPVPGLSSADSAGFARYAAMCVAVLDALQAAALRLPDARMRLERLDSLARTFIFEICCGEAVRGTNLVIAHLWESQGDLPRALRALRRRAGGYMLAPVFMSTFLREEGRLAALAGDTAGAVNAYQQYIRLRPDPEPEVRPEVERVRADLTKLLGEPVR